ncbi:MAG: transcriptional regulator [Xanthobacteraceae bacterium]
MKRGPRKGAATRTDFVANARSAWGRHLQDWVLVLAEEAARTTATAAAKKIGYSPAVVTHVLANAYPGDMGRVEGKVRGALMGATVGCPVLGDIRLDQCLDEQKKPFAGTSSIRSKLYHACRGGCPHSRLKRSDDDAE